MKWLFVIVAFFLNGCASIALNSDNENCLDPFFLCVQGPQIVPTAATQLLNLPPPNNKAVVAVYDFPDLTGQRKPNASVAQISTAVTQGAHIWLLQSLKRAGNGEWFTVVERVGLDNLLKERQIIRQTRESHGDKDKLKALLFAGVLIEGGIVGYDTNTATGGLGARLLGIGVSSEYRKDTVSIGMRLISVSTGEILLAISTEKTIFSIRMNNNLFRFIDAGTKLLEVEAGFTENESVSYAVRKAIDQAILEIIKEGEKEGLWEFKIQNNAQGELTDEE